MYQSAHELSLTGTLTGTQAGGAEVATVPSNYRNRTHWRHSLQVVVSVTATGAAATPTAGTLSVRGKVYGATAFQTLGTIALTAPDPVILEGLYDSLEVESTGLDADKTWTLHIVSGD